MCVCVCVCVCVRVCAYEGGRERKNDAIHYPVKSRAYKRDPLLKLIVFMPEIFHAESIHEGYEMKFDIKLSDSA